MSIHEPNRIAIQQRILENCHTTILLFDSDFRLTFINQAGEMLFSISARKLIGTLSTDIIVCGNNSVDTILARAIKTGQSYMEREVSIKLVEERTITVDCIVTPIIDCAGYTEVLVELLQVDHQLQVSQEEQLINQHHATSALIRGLGHEIKNPLGGLRGAAQLLEKKLARSDLQEYTQIIVEESDRLRNLVNRMLGPNKLPQRKMVNIHSVLERARQLVEAETEDNIQFIRIYDPSLPELNIDPDHVFQAILNIVRNAMQALEQTGVIILQTSIHRRLLIAGQPHRLGVKINVTDHGPGIPQHLKNSLFFPMVSGRSTGSGLGLSIAQSLINQQDGLIECKSRPGKTTFSILLPLQANKPTHL